MNAHARLATLHVFGSMSGQTLSVILLCLSGDVSKSQVHKRSE